MVATGEQNNKKQLEAMLGRAKVFEKAKKYESAVEVLSEACICFPNFLPAVIEKSKLHHYNGEFEQSLDTILQVLSVDKTNVEALRIYIFNLMTRENNLSFV